VCCPVIVIAADGLEWLQAPVYILFACAVANKDLLFVIYDIPSISICRGSQRKKAAENLGLPPSIFSDIEAYGGHIPECNALRAGEPLVNGHMAPAAAKRTRSSLWGVSSGDLGLPSFPLRGLGSEAQPDPLRRRSQGGLLQDVANGRGLGIDVISNALGAGSGGLGDMLKASGMEGSAALALLSSLQGQSLGSSLHSELLPTSQGAVLSSSLAAQAVVA
jgi:hypothetical protein